MSEELELACIVQCVLLNLCEDLLRRMVLFQLRCGYPQHLGCSSPSQGLHRISELALCILMEHQCPQRFGR